jgi:tetratricopeptide (TPR) repeat protein
MYEKMLEELPVIISSSSQYYKQYLTLLSKANYKLNRNDQCIELVKKVKEPSDELGYFAALSYLEKDDTEKAKVLFSWLEKNAEDNDIAKNSFFHLIHILSLTERREANLRLHKFIRINRDSDYQSIASYLLGSNYFETNELDSAAVYIGEALSYELKPEYKEKATYLLGEIWFRQELYDRAKNQFDLYLAEFTNGEFAGEAEFKISLFYYLKRDFITAGSRLNQYLESYPESDKKALAYFYLGEVYRMQNLLDQALNAYEEALNGKVDKGLTWKRIASIHFKLKNYDLAVNALTYLPDSPEFMFDKLMISGNIFYDKKSYKKAIVQYDKAVNAAQTEKQLSEVKNRLAWTCYKAGQFDRASEIYSELSKSGNASSNYLKLAAQAAFSADDYITAIDFYTQYAENLEAGEELNKVNLSIADAYYNLGDYSKAFGFYQKLAIPTVEAAVLTNALNGLSWTASMIPEISLNDTLQAMSDNAEDPNFKTAVLMKMLESDFKADKWLGVTKHGEEILRYNLTDQQRVVVNDYLSTALYNLSDFEAAEMLLKSWYMRTPEPKILVKLIQVYTAQKDTMKAMDVLTKNLESTDNAELIMTALKYTADLTNSTFNDIFNKKYNVLPDEYKESAKLNKIKYLLKTENNTEAESLISELLKSNQRGIKAKAQYYKGLNFYLQEKYNLAVPELLRVRYVYPDLGEIKTESEYTAILCYLKLDEKEKALQIFDMIKAELTEKQESELSEILEVNKIIETELENEEEGE